VNRHRELTHHRRPILTHPELVRSVRRRLAGPFRDLVPPRRVGQVPTPIPPECGSIQHAGQHSSSNGPSQMSESQHSGWPPSLRPVSRGLDRHIQEQDRRHKPGLPSGRYQRPLTGTAGFSEATDQFRCTTGRD
jgi:hypothetical protein